MMIHLKNNANLNGRSGESNVPNRIGEKSPKRICSFLKKEIFDPIFIILFWIMLYKVDSIHFHSGDKSSDSIKEFWLQSEWLKSDNNYPW